MAFIVGNVSDSLYPASVKTALANDNAPVYGVKWDSWPGTPQRLYDAQGKVVTLSTDTVKGHDDFENVPPFNVKECITQYNESTKKREVLAYKGDSNWDNLVTTQTGDRMIEFPCFWYKRLGVGHILISPEAKEGFKPSPAHFRGGVLYNKVRISKYCIDTVSGVSNKVAVSSLPVSQIDELRLTVRNKGAYLLDWPCYSIILLLGLVKHAQYDLVTYLGASATYSSSIKNGMTDSILGLDGSVNGYTCLFGIENFLGYTDTLIDGLYRVMVGGGVYGGYYKIYYTDVINLESTPKDISNTCDLLDVTTKFGWSSLGKLDVSMSQILSWTFVPSQNDKLQYESPNQEPGQAADSACPYWVQYSLYSFSGSSTCIPRFFEFE